jgi:hypothetical protein
MKIRTVLCATMMTLPIGLAHGQGAPSRATPPPTGDAAQGSIGDAIQSGVDRAAGEVLRGNTIGGAIQQGADQALRQGAADAARRIAPQAAPQQPIYQDGRRVYPSGQPTLSQTLYRDASGRLFRQDSFGNRYYVQSSPSMDARTGQANVQAQSRPRLGIGIEESEQGVQVTEVAEGSAAAQAGFQSGDVVISANGQQISSTDQLAQMVRNADPNAELNMKVMRDGEEQTLTATLASQQQDRYRAAKPAMNGSQANQSMSTRLQQLEQEVEQLKAKIQDLHGDEMSEQAKQQNRDQADSQAAKTDGNANNAAAQADTGQNAEAGQNSEAKADAAGNADAGAGEASADAEGSLNVDSPFDN